MHKVIRRGFAGLLTSAIAFTGLSLISAPAHAAFTSTIGGDITRSEVMQRAQYWLDHQPGSYSQSSFSPDPIGSRNYRRDCSGYVDMSWHAAGDYTTYNLSSITTAISRADLKPGDALNDAQHHVILFKQWSNSAHTNFDYYSFGSTPVKLIRNASISSGTWDGHPNSAYEARRYVHIKDDVVAPPPVVYDQSPGEADVNGDGKSDLVAQNDTSTWVMLSNGTSFNAPVQWSSVAFFGEVANHAGDVNGDGKADLIAQNQTDTWVMLSTGSSFSAPVRFSNVAFFGGVANHVGDVNGDGKADLVGQNETDTWVMLSTGSSFSAPVQFSNVAFVGSVANHIGDVNGDGKADLVAQNAAGAWVMLSGGASFGAPTQFSAPAFQGGIANHIEDINGDGKADLVAQNDSSVWVMLSSGTAFGAPAQWATGAFYGTVANHIGDITGDGKADLVAQNETDVWVRTSTASAFNSSAKWSNVNFFGQAANIG
ncbi:FG-GAP repeat domain-containing protein [Dactylosporangium cerinum]